MYLWRPTAGGKHDADQRPSFGAIPRLDGSAVRRDDGATDRKAQTNAPRAPHRAAVELLPDPFLVAGCKARPTIRDFDDHLIAPWEGGYENFRALEIGRASCRERV